jgi:diketogulonate reductase-like aldo/keto reductase
MMPAVGMGFVCRDGNKCASVFQSCEAFLRLGGRLIDTAPSYGHGRSHALIAKAIRSSEVRRQDLWLVSKIPVSSMGFESTLRRINASLFELGVAMLDTVLIHRPNNAASDPNKSVNRTLRLETWRALQEAQRLGLVRFPGVANFGKVYINEITEAGLPLPSVNEIEFNPLVNEEQRALVAFCQKLGIALIGYNSLGGSAADHRWARHIAAGCNITDAQLLLRYSLENGVAVIPTSSSVAHIRQNLQVGSLHLGAEEVANIDRLVAKQKLSSGRGWRHFIGNDPHHRQGLACDSAAKLLTRHVRAMAEVRALPGGVRTFDAHDWPTMGLCAEENEEEAGRLLGDYIIRSSQPFIVLPNFVKATQSEQLCESLRRRYPVKRIRGVPPKERCNMHDDGLADDKVNGDMRCEGLYQCQKWSKICEEYRTKSILTKIAGAYFSRELPGKDFKTTPIKVIASLVRGRGANSGGSWHQDESAKTVGNPDVGPQIKCLAYGANTRSSNAPFTMLIDYNATRMLSIRDPNDYKGRRHRWAAQAIADLTESTNSFVLELLAPAGSVICFESGSIHHGKQLEVGDRYSMTIYFKGPGASEGFISPAALKQTQHSRQKVFQRGGRGTAPIS